MATLCSVKICRAPRHLRCHVQIVACMLTGDGCSEERELHLSPRQCVSFPWKKPPCQYNIPITVNNAPVHACKPGTSMTQYLPPGACMCIGGQACKSFVCCCSGCPTLCGGYMWLRWGIAMLAHTPTTLASSSPEVTFLSKNSNGSEQQGIAP